jgi:DNA (cytosine-5)-methyltransferase 1
MNATYTLMDLFAGCGGMTLGFEQTERFESIFAVEWDTAAAETYRRNFGDHVVAGPIERVEHFPDCDVIIGGPPCQGFSPLNMLGVGLERRTLWREYARALREASPVAFIMENVPELLRSAEYHAFADEARELGYVVEGRILNAADYGVPQRRRRAIVVGSRLGSFTWPEATHFPPDAVALGGESWRTFRDSG